MDRILRLLVQLDDGVQPSLIRHGKGGIDAESELGEPNNISYVEPFEGFVVWNIEKDGLNSSRPGHTISLRQLGWTSGYGKISSVPLPRMLRRGGLTPSDRSAHP